MEHTHERLDPTGYPVNNLILREIPTSELRLLQKHLDHVVLHAGDTLYEPAAGITDSYFLNSGLASLVIDTDEGKTVEVGMAGREGMTGVGLVAGLKRTVHRAVVQVAGDSFRIEASALQTTLAIVPELEKKANRFAVIQLMQTAQMAACNRLHDANQRLARWLLMVQDRVEGPWLAITHDFLATMLGTDRPTVSIAAKRLQDQQAIEYVYGAVRVVNRHRLEDLACECYQVIQQFNEELGLNQQALAS